MRNTIFFILTATTLLAMILASCGVKKQESAGANSRNGHPATVLLATAAAATLDETITLTGSLLPWREATVSVEVDGRIEMLTVDLGSVVSAGSVIARIAPEEYHLKVRQAEAEVKTAEADLTRTTNLAEKEMATRQQVDEATRRLELARVALDTAKKKLGDTEVRAPFDGIIAKRLVNAGEYVRTGTPLFYIVQTMPLKFTAAVPERYATAVRSGMTISLTSVSGGTVTGTIRRIGPFVDQQSRSFTIEAEVPNRGRLLTAGSFATATLTIPLKQQIVTVPEAALVSFAGTDKVFVFVGDHLEERIVTVASRGAGTIAVSTGIAPGDRVVVSAAETLYHGMPAVPRAE